MEKKKKKKIKKLCPKSIGSLDAMLLWETRFFPRPVGAYKGLAILLVKVNVTLSYLRNYSFSLFLLFLFLFIFFLSSSLLRFISYFRH